MCAACGSPAHVPDLAPPPAEPPPVAAPRRFAALRNKDCRPYLFGAGLAMMADNIEHVITYWVLWQTFHSAALVGFQVISHWVPFLLFSRLLRRAGRPLRLPPGDSGRAGVVHVRSRSPGACCS